MLKSDRFYLKITVPAQLTNTCSTLINYFLCKLTENTLDTTSCVLIKRFSDHQHYFNILNNILTKVSPPVYVKVIEQDNESKQNLYNEILKSDKLINLKMT